MTLLIAALLAAFAGMVLAVSLPSRVGRAAGFLGVALSGACAAIAGIDSLVHAGTVAEAIATPYVDLRLDPIAGFFLAVVGVVALLSALYALGGRTADERRTGRTAASAACLIVLSSLLACTAANVLLFIFAWELLALGFFWAVTFAGDVAGAERSGYFTLVLTHVAGACLAIGLLALARTAHSFAIPDVVSAAAQEPTGARYAIFLLLLIGFGAKFGMPPMYAWLRYAYRSSPSVIAALMAGGALNVGFYGIARFVVPFGGPIPAWLPIVLLALGACGAVYGIALAVGERDIRSLAAYSSVENAGIILAGFGIALCGRVVGDPMLYGLGIATAFLQIVAHALAKSTLFLVCSSIRERCSTTSFELLGGLATRMPLTTVVGIVAALSLAALPPLAGFAGEWLTLESMMQAFRTDNVPMETALAISGALIGLAAGIAVVAFVKTVGIAMLGAPRSDDAATASEISNWLKRALLVAGGVSIIAAGVASRSLVELYSPAVTQFGDSTAAAAIVKIPFLLQPAYSGFSSASPLGLLCVISGFMVLFWLITRAVARPQARSVPAWTSGEPYWPWTQYTGTGFANPTRVILDAMTRTVRDLEEDTYESRSRPYFSLQWYEKISGGVLRLADIMRRTQSGVIAAYLAYILGFVIVVLLLYPSIRRW